MISFREDSDYSNKLLLLLFYFKLRRENYKMSSVYKIRIKSNIIKIYVYFFVVNRVIFAIVKNIKIFY